MPILVLILNITLLTAAALAQPLAPFTDPRDNKTYRTVKIGEQVWMAENLNYDAKGSLCYRNKYDNKPENCEKYGRFYNWITAMNACPSGWHLPSNEEWGILVDFAGGQKVAGKKLKAKTGWSDNIKQNDKKPGNGTDDFGFAAIPSGYRSLGEEFITAGYNGVWWTNSKAYNTLKMNFAVETANIGFTYATSFHSVRCVRD